LTSSSGRTIFIYLLPVNREKVKITSYVLRTRLGWIIRGVTNRDAHALAVRSFIISGWTQLDQLTSEMRRFCDTEAFRTEYKQGCLSPDNQRAMALVKEKTRKLAVRYEVPIGRKEGRRKEGRRAGPSEQSSHGRQSLSEPAAEILTSTGTRAGL
jgi:hypothetical protein